jgi:glycosyltransferase involved in cell wall biosynthesis
MRICLLGNAADIHVQRWAGFFIKRGHEVQVISLTPGAVDGAKVHYVQWWPPVKQVGYLAALPKIRRLVKRISPDVLHSHYAISYGVLGALTGFRPHVIGAWGSDILISPGTSKLRWAVLGRALRQADFITSLSGQITRMLIERGVPAEKIKTLPFGVDTRLFRARGNSDCDPDVDIICTRRLDNVYNVEVLLRALPKIIAHRPNLVCVLAGDGPQKETLKTLAHTLGIEKHLRWLGWLSPAELATWLRRAKVYVSPSLSDGTSTALTEAMACGCFPVVSDIVANHPWVENGRTGLLFPPSDPGALGKSLLEALESESLRKEALAINREKVNKDANLYTIMGSVEERYDQLVRAVSPV